LNDDTTAALLDTEEVGDQNKVRREHELTSAYESLSSLPRAIVGGFLGTIVFTLIMKFLAPMMIGHPMDIAVVLGTFTGLGTSTGMVMRFLLGSLGFAVGSVIAPNGGDAASASTITSRSPPIITACPIASPAPRSTRG